MWLQYNPVTLQVIGHSEEQFEAPIDEATGQALWSWIECPEGVNPRAAKISWTDGSVSEDADLLAKLADETEAIQAQRIAQIRMDRDAKLTESDKYMLADYPITSEQRALAVTYRQALRDMMAGINPDDFEWPENPIQ